MSNELEQTVREVLSHVLRSPIEPDASVKRSETPAWDSLKHVEIMFSLEDAFGVTFDQSELASLDSVDSIVTAIQAHQTSE